ncbi:MAG: glycine--tRNA ligase subunit beta, partial [Woeseiales bacterium]
VHWLILLHGDQVVPAEVFGIASGRSTRGHRFMSSGEIPISSPAVYADTLLSDGFVVADFSVRKSIISAAVDKAAAAVDGSAVGDESLIDEVTALTEWPVAVTGSFDKVFLDLPKEVIVQTLMSHQRYFPVTDGNGELIAKFITISNLRSKDPERVRDGNERVVRPRLADAAFFWETDQHSPLESRTDALKKVVYQKGLGTLHEKSMRVAALASRLAEQVGADTELVTRAAVLAKCDLLTGMVGEFPELQGVMGRYYATSSGEAPEVCQAIGDQYLPAFAGDVLPESVAGQILAVADRLDTLAGIFLLGKKPTGNRDPFGVRRAALGVVRILIEKDLDIDLSEAVVAAVLQQPITTEDRNEKRDALYDYIIERLRGYIVDADNGLTTDMFEAVKIRRPPSLVDFYARLVAVSHFVVLDAANGLAAANKRTANILRKAKLADGVADNLVVDSALLKDDVERDLFHALQSAQKALVPLIEARAYSDALRRLSELRAPVDAFFDGVMVMVDDDALQRNRLALLVELRALFLGVADISSLTDRE